MSIDRKKRFVTACLVDNRRLLLQAVTPLHACRVGLLSLCSMRPRGHRVVHPPRRLGEHLLYLHAPEAVHRCSLGQCHNMPLQPVRAVRKTSTPPSTPPSRIYQKSWIPYPPGVFELVRASLLSPPTQFPVMVIFPHLALSPALSTLLLPPPSRSVASRSPVTRQSRPSRTPTGNTANRDASAIADADDLNSNLYLR